jgi:CubicO group peptidase (beta-lactamase class C family)
VVVLGILITFSHVSAQAEGIDRILPELEMGVAEMMEAGKVPSAAIALVKGEKILWSGGFGYSNLWAKTPASADTIYLIGSTFKTMSTYAILQQMEQGRFSLDEPVHRYLKGIQIQGDRSDNPVTFRHLFTHTSGLPADYGPHNVWGPTVPLPLEDYLRRSLKLNDPPMTKVVYSNTAYTLIAYLLEEFSGVSFKRYIQKNIFDPLEMTDTAFAPRPDMEERLAMPYLVEAKTGRNIPAHRTKANVWPAGIVYGTVIDQAKWLIANLNRAVYKSHRLLEESTFQTMMITQFEQFQGPIARGWLNETTGYGLTWWISQRKAETLFAHSGSVDGYTAFLVGNLDQKTGFAILTNGHRAHPHLYKLAVKALDLLAK